MRCTSEFFREGLREDILDCIGIDIMLDENTFKGAARVICELAEVWSKLVDINTEVTMMEVTKEQNKKLIERYPFLLPRNQCTDDVPEDYDYSYTELDAMPDGWRIAFGEQMCEEIRQELERAGCLDEYRIVQIKEKYGSLQWYDFGCTEKMLREIIPKYEKISAYTCIRCGKPATRITMGWICPFCDDCVPKKRSGEHYQSIPIEEYYKKCMDESEN